MMYSTIDVEGTKKAMRVNYCRCCGRIIKNYDTRNDGFSRYCHKLCLRRSKIPLNFTYQLFSLLLFLFLLSSIPITNSAKNAYQILGLNYDCKQDDIRRRYRRLCLDYHPDKNSHKSIKEIEQCEEKFKLVQSAYDKINTDVKRNYYDQTLLMKSSSSSSSHYRDYESTTTEDAFYRAFREYQRRYGASSGGGYSGVNEGDFERQQRRGASATTTQSPFLFSPLSGWVGGIGGGGNAALFGFPSFRFTSPLVGRRHYFASPDEAGAAAPASPQPFKSVYMQEVKIPLDILYSGTGSETHTLHLADSIWRRYRGAYRGKFLGRLVIQCLLSSIPLLMRSRLSVASAFFLLYLQHSLPRPAKLDYNVCIKKGWKDGTRLTYDNIDPGFIVVFVLKEEKHDRYRRYGKYNLRTGVKIAERDAKRGCRVRVKPLGRNEESIVIQLKPGEAAVGRGRGRGRGYGSGLSDDAVVKVVKGRGWPKKDGSRGDLYVNVQVLPDEEMARRRRKKKKNRKIGGGGRRVFSFL